MPFPSSTTYPGPGLFPGLGLSVSESGNEIWESLGPWMRADSTLHLLVLCEAIGAKLIQPIADVVLDTEGQPGWSIVMDADLAPSGWLPWLGQFAGVRIPPGLDDANQRSWIREVSGFKRGSPGAMIAAAQSTLTGSKSVFLNERDTSPYHLSVDTLIEETPDPPATLAAILTQKPAGIVLNHNVIAGMAWDEATGNWDAATGTWDAP